jgi:maltose/moltooligosaccharide transporter
VTAAELGETVLTDPSPPGPTTSIYSVGTLHYSKAGLFLVFFYLLWGDFCFTFMEAVFPTLMPLKLASLGASNALIALLMATIPAAINFVVVPIISFRSDRYRSRWGRRIPFLIWPTPIIGAVLVLLAFSDELGAGVARIAGDRVSPVTAAIGVIALLTVSFQFANMFVTSIFYYLFNDVVPEAFLARFISLFRLVGIGCSALFNYTVLPYAETHMREIYLVAAGLYVFGFTLMCLRVREGSYPPPPPNIDQRTGVVAAAKTYFAECFSHRFYWSFFLATGAWAAALTIGMFNIFAWKALGLTLEQLGKIGAVGAIVGMLLVYPAGWVADRYHPVRMYVVTMVALLPLNAIGLINLFVLIPPEINYRLAWVTMCISMPIQAVAGACLFPYYMRLLPRSRYGQFSSADAMVRSACTIVAAPMAGLFMDTMKYLHRHGSDPMFYYRYVPVWMVLFHLLTIFFMLRVYRNWKRLGGDTSYTPPEPAVAVGSSSGN